MSSNYTAERPLWFAKVPLTAGSEVRTVSYKYARQQDCGQPWIWESVNRTIEVPVCVEGNTEVVSETDEAWVGEVGRPGGC